MADDIMLFPSLNEELVSKIRFQKQKFQFFYTDADDEEYELVDEPVEAFSSCYCIKDENGKWTQDDNNLCFRRKYCLRTFQCLFGENGIACKNAKLGMAIQWKSPDSRQRGVVKIGEFSADERIMEAEVEYRFVKAQLRGQVNFSTVIYLAEAGNPTEEETHLANTEGYILGELESYTLKLDGSSSAFPVFEVSEPGQPLWYIKCDWDDPTCDAFSECVSINLNTAHKSFAYIDRNQKVFDSQLLSEIMASAITLIIEKVRHDTAYWDQIVRGESLEQGSVGQAIYYFKSALDWDLSDAETVSLCARKLFDQRM